MEARRVRTRRLQRAEAERTRITPSAGSGTKRGTPKTSLRRSIPFASKNPVSRQQEFRRRRNAT